MILIPLDPSINIPNFGVGMIDTSRHKDPYRCIVPIEQPNVYRKRMKIRHPDKDPSGLQRAKILNKWGWKVFSDIHKHYYGLCRIVIITELSAGQPIWASGGKNKAGRARRMDLNVRSADWVLSIGFCYGFEVIEVDPTNKQMFSTAKDDRVNRMNCLSVDTWRPEGLTKNQLEHVADALYHGCEWYNWEKIRNPATEGRRL